MCMCVFETICLDYWWETFLSPPPSLPELGGRRCLRQRGVTSNVFTHCLHFRPSTHRTLIISPGRLLYIHIGWYHVAGRQGWGWAPWHSNGCRAGTCLSPSRRVRTAWASACLLLLSNYGWDSHLGLPAEESKHTHSPSTIKSGATSAAFFFLLFCRLRLGCGERGGTRALSSPGNRPDPHISPHLHAIVVPQGWGVG